MEFSRQEYWSGLLFPSPGDLPDPMPFPALQVDYLFTTELPGKPKHDAWSPVNLSLYLLNEWINVWMFVNTGDKMPTKLQWEEIKRVSGRIFRHNLRCGYVGGAILPPVFLWFASSMFPEPRILGAGCGRTPPGIASFLCWLALGWCRRLPGTELGGSLREGHCISLWPPLDGVGEAWNVFLLTYRSFPTDCSI